MNTSIDRFSEHAEAFDEAARYIHEHCTEFAGRSIRAEHSPWPHMVLAREFSNCDPAVRAKIYDCTLSAGSELIPAIAEVSIDGNVIFRSAQ